MGASHSLEASNFSLDNSIYHFKENLTFVRQTEFNFTHFVEKKSNNYGFFSNQYFDKSESSLKEVVAVIGDSLVEALKVKNEDTFHSILSLIDDERLFYLIAASGTPLTQYPISEFKLIDFV